MYKIKIKTINILGFHGLLKEEKTEGQLFKIDFEYCIKKDISKIMDEIESNFTKAA